MTGVSDISTNLSKEKLQETLEESRRKLQESGGRIPTTTPEERRVWLYEGLDGCEYDTETGQLTITDPEKYEESLKRQSEELANPVEQYNSELNRQRAKIKPDESTTKQPKQFKLFSLETFCNIIGLIILYGLSVNILVYRDQLREKKKQQE